MEMIVWQSGGELLTEMFLTGQEWLWSSVQKIIGSEKINRSFILMLVKAEHKEIDVDGMGDAIGDFANSLFTDLVFSVR